MRQDVRTQLSKVYTPLDTIEAKLNDRKSKLHNALMRGQEFSKSFDEDSNRLGTIEINAQRRRPISFESVPTNREELYEHK